MCWVVSYPAQPQHWAVSTLGTLRLYRNFASPIRPARACASTELSAFLSLERSLSTALLGGVSLGAALLPGNLINLTIITIINQFKDTNLITLEMLLLPSFIPFLISTLNHHNRLLNLISTSLKAKNKQVLGIKSVVALDVIALEGVSVR
jgi:hypothetical protein